MAIFTEKHIKSDCDSGSFQRGKDYYKSGRVQDFKVELEVEERSIIISGCVSGNYRYTQNIEVIRENNLVDIDGDCSCPVGYNCKHVVAVLLDYLKKFGHNKTFKELRPKRISPQKKALNQWLTGLSGFPQPVAETHINDPKQWLAYILKKNPLNDSIEIDFVRTGIKKMVAFTSLKAFIFTHFLIRLYTVVNLNILTLMMK